MHFKKKNSMSNTEEKGLKDNESSKFTAHYNYSYHLIYIPAFHAYIFLTIMLFSC